MEKTLHEFKNKSLHIGKSKKKVKSKTQAVAIGLDIARRKGAKIPKKPKK